MPEDSVHLYEGMFLLSQAAAMELATGVEHVKGILERHGVEILILRKWDERKLAYPIRGQKRGTYVLGYFKAKASAIGPIDRDCNLSEQVSRAMIIRADHVGDIELEIARKQENLTLAIKLKSDVKPAGVEAEGAVPVVAIDMDLDKDPGEKM